MLRRRAECESRQQCYSTVFNDSLEQEMSAVEEVGKEMSEPRGRWAECAHSPFSEVGNRIVCTESRCKMQGARFARGTR